jgi:hypothetical protein
MRHHRRRIVPAWFVGLALVTGLWSGTAVAAVRASHTLNGIAHGQYRESRPGADYHHAWTEHGHTGFRYVEVVRSTTYATGCAASSTTTHHVHCTTYFDGYGLGYHDTGASCAGEASAPSYADGHGICGHFNDEV